MTFTIDASTWRSPNYDKTASGAPITHAPAGMLLHSDEGTRASSLPWLCSPESGVSCQYYVCRPNAAGQIDIYQLVPDTYRAWHAGSSSYDGLTDWNKAIGVEAEHKAGQDWPKAQCDALTWLFQTKITAYTLPRSRIATHRAVATPPGRKSDPTNWTDASFAAWADRLYVPVDPLGPLTTNALPGAAGPVLCSKPTYDFYYAEGRGFSLFGYATSKERLVIDPNGLTSTVTPCERALIKRSKEYGTELFLLSEAATMGLLP